MSYKILIVEDDINFRYAIREIIPWEENGFEIEGEAIHGIQALQVLEKQKIDIVITDMSMPLMNGIELTKEISRRYPDILVVAFSAYDDFNFVKEAMKNGAKDYILKQELDPDEVITTLKNICKEKEQKNEKEDTRERLRYYAMKWLTTGGSPEEQVYTYVSGLIGEKRVMLLKIMTPGQEEVNIVLDKGAEKILFRKYDEEGNLYLIWQLQDTNSIRQQLEEQHQIIKEIQHSCESAGHILVSDTVRGISDFEKVPDELVQLQRILPYVKNKMLLYGDYAAVLKKREPDFQYVEDKKLSFSSLEKNRKPLEKNRKPLEKDQNPLEKMEAILLKQMPDEDKLNEAYIHFYYQISQAEKFGENKNAEFIEGIRTRNTIWEKSEYLFSYIKKQWNEKNAGFQGAGQKIEAAVRYIREHYQEDISLADIAEHVGLNENYFSNLFKMSTGENLTKYINRVRIEKAMDYLEHTNLKVYEIGEMVGYNNTTYFSTMFKKITGQSVSEFRNGK